MVLWPWDIVQPIRTYLARKRRSRWKQSGSKGTCPSCKQPFDKGKKRCVVDSCGHEICYSCLCAQDACAVCIRETVIYRSTKKHSRSNEKTEKRKSNETPIRTLMNISNGPSLVVPDDAGPSGIYQKGQHLKCVSRPSSLREELSFDEMITTMPECFLALKPLYFEVPQPESENAFLYREWIFQEISKVLTSNLRGVALVGDEGSGKTTLILQLVDWSSFGRKRKSGIISEAVMSDISVFEQLASKVVGYHFCQSDCFETCLIPDFIHSLAAQLCQAPQLMEYRNFLAQNPSCQQLLSLNNIIKDPDTAFKKGILDPLCSLQNLPLTSELLVIDSVHEAEDQLRSITSFLSTYLEKFPSWLKVVLSVKSSYVNLVHSLPLHRIQLDFTELKVQEDLVRYARCRIAKSPAIQTNISAFGDDNQVSRFIDHLVTGGQASFLFLRLVLDLFQQNYLVVKSSTFNVIPISMDEVFTLTFNLKFPSTTTFSKVKSILEICLASLNPLTALEIYYTLESTSVVPALKWTEFTQILRSLHGILIQRKDESLMISHPALRNWLQNNKKFTCDIGRGHTYLALLPARMQFTLTKDKELEIAHHLSNCSFFKDGIQLQTLWLLYSSINVSNILASPRAVFWPNPKIIRLLLESGADAKTSLNAHDKCSTISVACRIGCVEVVTLLLKYGASPNEADGFGVTPLMEAAKTGHSNVIEVLLSAEAKVHLKDKVGQCALSLASENGYLDIVNILIQTKYWPSIFLRSQAIQRSLIAASGAGKFQICEYLMKSISSTSDIAVNQLRIAISQGQAAVCKLFLNDSLPDSDTVRLAAFRGHIPVLRVLSDKEINWNFKDEYGRTALFWACINNQTESVRFLLERRACIELIDNQQLKPIHLAAMFSNSEVVRLLLHHGADPMFKTKENNSALECAINADNFSTCIELIKGGYEIGEEVFSLARNHPHIYSSLLCKLLSDGLALYKEGQFTEASHRFVYGLQKCSDENYHLRCQFQEKLEQCKRIINRNSKVFSLESNEFFEFQDDNRPDYSLKRKGCIRR